MAPVGVPWLWPAACPSGVPRGPAWCAAPCLVPSLSVLRLTFPTPWFLSPSQGLSPPDLLGGCAMHAEAGREPGSLCLPLAPTEAGALGSLHVVPVRGPAMGLSLAGPSGVGLWMLALRRLACVDPVTNASGFPYCPSFDGGLGRCTGVVSCGRRHLPLQVGGYHARVPCMCACARPSWPGRGGRPPGRVLVRLTLSLAVLSLCFAWPPPVVLVCLPAFRSFFFVLLPPLFLAFAVFRPLVSWALGCLPPPPPPPLFLAFLLWLVFVFCRPPFQLPSPPFFFVFIVLFAACLVRCLFPLALLFLFLAHFPCLLFSLPPSPPPVFLSWFFGAFCFGWCLFPVAFLFRPPPFFFFFFLCLHPGVCFLSPSLSSTPLPSACLFIFLCPPLRPPFFFQCFLLWLVFLSCRLPIPLPPPPRFGFFLPPGVCRERDSEVAEIFLSKLSRDSRSQNSFFRPGTL